MIATDISNLSTLLSNESTREDVDRLLGNNFDKGEIYPQATDFSSSPNETGVIYKFVDQNQDSYYKKYTGVVISFDENGKVCDNAYIGCFYNE